MVGKKKILFILFCCLLFILPARPAVEAQNTYAELPQPLNARSYVLMEMETGRILNGLKENHAYPPASLTKIMTEYVVLKELKAGKLDWDDPVNISHRAASIGESQVYLKAGETHTVKELFTVMAVYSANDATVALAEHVAGSETAFVKKMNREAERLGLKNTHFTNATGLPRHSYPDPPEVDGKLRMSSLDIARLTRHMLQKHPEVKKIISLPTYTFQKGNKKHTVINRNTMLPGLPHFYKGVDGVKTGFTSKAGYNFVGTAKRKGMRLITVVMGTPSKNRRFTETKKLLDYAYEEYQMKPKLKKGKEISEDLYIQVQNGSKRKVPVVSADTRRILVKDGEENRYSVQVELKYELEAPVQAGTVVGKARILYDGKKIPGVKPVRIVIKEDVEKAGWFTQLLGILADWFI